jgi:hypothetical protein
MLAASGNLVFFLKAGLSATNGKPYDADAFKHCCFVCVSACEPHTGGRCFLEGTRSLDGLVARLGRLDVPNSSRIRNIDG